MGGSTERYPGHVLPDRGARRRLLARLAPFAVTLPAYRRSRSRLVIDADVARWFDVGIHERWGWPAEHLDLLGRDPELMFLGLFRRARAFRDLFYFRIGGDRAGQPAARLFRSVFPGEAALHIWCADIGPGLYLAHGYATFVLARRIGANCRIHQNVTLGQDSVDGGWPTLEDDVTVYTGAVVFGEITLGRGSIVGANAVVNRDVPPGHLAVGVPATVKPRRANGLEDVRSVNCSIAKRS
jgi:serine O-acetyltransferase